MNQINHDDDLRQAERLNATWDAAIADESAVDAETTALLRRIHAAAAAPEPAPEFLADLRSKLGRQAPAERSRAAGARLGLVAAPIMSNDRPAMRRLAAVAAILAVVLGAAIAGGWPTEGGDVPLVASALASSEAGTAAAAPTSTVPLPTTQARTTGSSVSLWSAPAVGTPHAALPPSTLVELLGEEMCRPGKRWLHVRTIDGETGWVRADDVVRGDR